MNKTIILIESTPPIITIILVPFLTFIFSIFGFLISKVYYKSFEEYKNIKGELAETFLYYGNVFSVPRDSAKFKGSFLQKFSIASEKCRIYAAKIDGYIVRKPKGEIWISKTNLKDVSKELVGLANTVNEENNTFEMVRDMKKAIEKIKKLLNI